MFDYVSLKYIKYWIFLLAHFAEDDKKLQNTKL